MNYIELEYAISSYLRIKPSTFRHLLRTAPYRYRHYQIDKRGGGKRDIFHPAPELKAAQRWLVAEIFSRLRISEAAAAYEAGCSIRSHALSHVHSNYFTKLDFKDFFPSIKINWVERFLQENLLGFDEASIHAISRLACRSSRDRTTMALSIGAPSSPTLSNRMLFSLDTALLAEASIHRISYSRYADDIYFSSRKPNELRAFEMRARNIIFEQTPELRLNESKTLHTSRKRLVMISGVRITPDRALSVGRHLKRSIKTRVFLWSTGSLSPEATATLRGLMCFVMDVEPNFYASIRHKFGAELIDRLISGIDPPGR